VSNFFALLPRGHSSAGRLRIARSRENSAMFPTISLEHGLNDRRCQRPIADISHAPRPFDVPRMRPLSSRSMVPPVGD
jgi:hypothetical protein